MAKAKQKSEVETRGKPRDPNSFVGRLCDLGVGESEARIVKLSLDEIDSTTITETLTKMHNTARAPIVRASERSGFEFSNEGGRYISNDNTSVYLFIVTTRTA